MRNVWEMTFHCSLGFLGNYRPFLKHLRFFWSSRWVEFEIIWGLLLFGLLAILSTFWDIVEISSEALVEANLRLLGAFSFRSLGKFENILRHCWDYFWSSCGNKLEIKETFSFWFLGKSETLLKFLLKL